MDVRKTQAQIVGTTTYGTGREESIASGQATVTSGGGKFPDSHFLFSARAFRRSETNRLGGYDEACRVGRPLWRYSLNEEVGQLCSFRFAMK